MENNNGTNQANPANQGNPTNQMNQSNQANQAASSAMDEIRRSPFYQKKMEAESIQLVQKIQQQIKQGTETLTKRELYPDEEELSAVQNVTKDIQVEEFPEGAYGSTVYLDQKIGKSSPWEVDQHVVSRFQDENPAFSDRRVPVDGEHPDEPSPAHGGESPEINN